MAALLALLAGCATTPPPTGLMDQADRALEAARNAGASDYAPLELGFADKKLDLAKAAMSREDYDIAADLAEESEANSALARVKAQLGKTREQIKQQSEENARLRQRMGDQGDGSGGGA